jgi:hypothetical protein
MTKTLKEFKQELNEAVASKQDIQYVAAKTDRNEHFEARRYIADKILNDKKLADFYKSLEYVHDKFYSSHSGQTVMLRQRIEKDFYAMIKRKITNWSDILGAL